MNLQPAGNIQAASVAGFIAVMIEHVCKANGIIIPDDVATALPGVLAILVAHVYDMLTNGNPKQVPNERNSSNPVQPKL